MGGLSIVVLGAGVSGLSAALALARDGHRVTLVERDELAVGDPAAALASDRRGIPHFHQPHAFIPRGRKELREQFPDVADDLIAAGAEDHDLRSKIRGEARPGDEDFAYLAARRPLIEWALRKAALAEPLVRSLAGTRATGYVGRTGPVPVVTGVTTDGGTIDADLVVDAMGRRTPGGEWLAALGRPPRPARTTDCGIIYYSRYYRVRDDAELPDGPWLPTPRGDLGYGAFSSFPGDNRTFAAVLAIPPGDQELKVLKHAAAYDAATPLMPALHAWTSPEVSIPITDVLPMGSLQNTMRLTEDGRPDAVGVIGIGDTICHTDPSIALGLSFGPIHARLLAAALRDHAPDLAAVAAAFEAEARPDVEERFRYASEIDAARSRGWAGEPVDIAHRDGGAYALFTLAAGTVAALRDGDIFRAVVRRNTFLDPLSVVDDDVAMQIRIEEEFAAARAASTSRPGPSRDDLLAAARKAMAVAEPAPA